MKTHLAVSLGTVALLAIMLLNSPVLAESFAARVSGVTAGDIYHIDRSGNEELVVLYGAQVGPNPLAAKQAREYATQNVLNHHVTVRVVDRRPGMTLVEFTLADGSNLSHVMLRQGLLRWDSFTARDDQGLKDLEALAKQEKLGMWRSAVAEPSASTPAPTPRNSAITDEIQYERRFAAGYDILEGRSWTDENGVRTIVLRGNGEKWEGFESAVEQQAAEENQARRDEQIQLAEEAAAAQAEADRIYQEQLRAEEQAAQQAQMQNLQWLNQQFLLGGYNSYTGARGIRIVPGSPY
jgi:hypothetical protein